MNNLDRLENRSLYIIREAYFQHHNIALLWSAGKDSTVLLQLCRKAFFGRVPFPVLHIDTGFKFRRIYEFRDYFAEEWELDLHICRNEEAISQNANYMTNNKLDCCHARKTEALRQTVTEYEFKALMVGIRGDENGIRAKERCFSPRDKNFNWSYMSQPAEPWDTFKTQPEKDAHLRVHPLLDWTEQDIWEYIRREEIPVIDLYFACFGKRFRSIGCEPCCMPIESDARNVDEIIEELKTCGTAERAGRAQDKEDPNTMQNLRAIGYL